MKTIGYFFLLATLTSSCAFIRSQPNEILESARASESYDVIIVPGHPYKGESWSTTMNYRIAWSVYLYKSGLAENIIFSGNSVYSEYVEAKVMAKYAIGLGVPAEHIFLDTNAEHSTENVYYSYRVAKENGFKRIALATDPFQNISLNKFIRRHQLDIAQIPAVFDTIGPPSKSEPLIDPSSARNTSFVSIKEKEGFFKRFGGTLGKNIIWLEEDLKSEALIKKYEKEGRLIRTIYTVQNL